MYFLKATTEQEMQEKIKYLSLHDPSVLVRREAVKQLKDEWTIQHIAQTDNDSIVRQIAVRKLSDQYLFLI